MTPRQMLVDLHLRFAWVHLRRHGEVYGIFLGHTHAFGLSAAEAIRNLYEHTGLARR